MRHKNYSKDISPDLIAGYDLEEDCCGREIVPSIFQTSIFCYHTVDDLRQAISCEEQDFIYTRGNNPTMRTVEKKLAALEHTDEARLFASGMAAMSAAILANLKAGDHVVCVSSVYRWTHYLVSNFLVRFGVKFSFVTGLEVEEFAQNINPATRVIILESPSSLLFRMQDLEAVAGLARTRGIVTVVDNTWSTPLFQNPVDWGIDLVVHSASKYFGGHSDLVAGCVMGSHEQMTRIFSDQLAAHGGIISPVNAWLILRGLRTLEVRLGRHQENAMKVADFLATHPAVESVIYPGHPTFAQKDLADKYLKGSSGLLGFRLVEKRVAILEDFVNALQIPHIAVSWGGYESLVFPVFGKYTDGRTRVEGNDSIIRLHVGLESPELLIEDLDKALNLIREG